MERNIMKKFNVGDWVYASDWCYGCIIEIEDGFAIVEFDTNSGGGNCSFMLEDLKKAEAPYNEENGEYIDYDWSDYSIPYDEIE